MTSALDIYRSAKRLIDQLGVGAIHAAMNADKCLERNDFDGKAVTGRRSG
jgi:hypothetical protein